MPRDRRTAGWRSDPVLRALYPDHIRKPRISTSRPAKSPARPGGLAIARRPKGRCSRALKQDEFSSRSIHQLSPETLQGSISVRSVANRLGGLPVARSLGGRELYKTKLGRNLAAGIVIATALDFALAYALAKYFFKDDFLISFLAILAFFWVTPFVFVFKNALFKMIAYHLERKKIRKSLVHEFRKSQFPLLSDTEFNDPADMYFEEVANDESLPKHARIAAAKTIGELSVIAKYSWADAFITYSNLDAALADYFDELRRDNVPPHQGN